MLQLLTICAANICRSPAAAGILAALEPYGVVVGSAGVSADNGREMCPRSRAWLATQLGNDDLGAAHRSRRLSEQLIAESDLVLVASLRQRKLVATMAPAAISRLFTYREAALLAGHANRGDLAASAPAAPPERARHRAPDSGRPDSVSFDPAIDPAATARTLTEFVRRMAALRGVVQFPYDDEEEAPRSEPRRRWRRSQTPTEPLVSPYDVPDAHSVPDGDHAPTFAALGPAVQDLTEQLRIALST